jgi:phosphoglycerate-specific signal transduction histidine kinase
MVSHDGAFHLNRTDAGDKQEVCSALDRRIGVGIRATIRRTLARNLRSKWPVSPRSLRDAINRALRLGTTNAHKRITLANTDSLDVVLVNAEVVEQKLLQIRRSHAVSTPDTDENLGVLAR